MLETSEEEGPSMLGPRWAWLSTSRQGFCWRGTLGSSSLWILGNRVVPGSSIPGHECGFVNNQVHSPKCFKTSSALSFMMLEIAIHKPWGNSAIWLVM